MAAWISPKTAFMKSLSKVSMVSFKSFVVQYILFVNVVAWRSLSLGDDRHNVANYDEERRHRHRLGCRAIAIFASCVMICVFVCVFFCWCDGGPSILFFFKIKIIYIINLPNCNNEKSIKIDSLMKSELSRRQVRSLNRCRNVLLSFFVCLFSFLGAVHLSSNNKTTKKKKQPNLNFQVHCRWVLCRSDSCSSAAASLVLNS